MADRRAGGRELARVLVNLVTLVSVAEQRTVDPLEFEHHSQRLSNRSLGKGRATAVHEQALGLGRDLVRYLRLDHLATADRCKVVTGGPVLGLVLNVDVEFASLERFERYVAVPIELDFHAVD